MKTRSIPLITKQLVVFILALVLLPFVAMAKDTATLDKQLVEAVQHGDVALAETLLNRGADPNAEGLDAESPLILAARSGHLELVKLLLDKGADVNAED